MSPQALTLPAASEGDGINDRPPNYRVSHGRLYLVRCFACGGDRGRENWALAVAFGQCAWCGWIEKEE